MDYLEEFIDLYSRDIDPERCIIAFAIHYIKLINHGGSDIGRPDDDSAPHNRIIWKRSSRVSQR